MVTAQTLTTQKRVRDVCQAEQGGTGLLQVPKAGSRTKAFPFNPAQQRELPLHSEAFVPAYMCLAFQTGPAPHMRS